MTEKVKLHLTKLSWFGTVVFTFGAIYEYFFGQVVTAKMLLFLSWVFMLIFFGVKTTKTRQ